MILGFQEEEIVKLAIENQNENFDGVVQYDYETGEIYGCSMSQGETENPNNPVIEVFRLEQGEMGVIEYDCDDCYHPYNDEEAHRKCCMEAYIDISFDEEFEDKFKEPLEKQIRNVLKSHLFETIEQLNQMRIALSDLNTPHHYFNVRDDDWSDNIFDAYVDCAIEDGFDVNTEPLNYLDAEYQYILSYIESIEMSRLIMSHCDIVLKKAMDLFKKRKLTEAIAVLNGDE